MGKGDSLACRLIYTSISQTTCRNAPAHTLHTALQVGAVRFHNFTLADNGALFVAAGSAFPAGVDPTTVPQPSVGQYESQPKDNAAAFELAWVVDDRARDVTDMQVMAGLQNSTLIAYTAKGQVGAASEAVREGKERQGRPRCCKCVRGGRR